MTVPIVLVSGDFVLTGGMDRANHALGSYLLDRGCEVHFVSHRVDPALLARPGAVWHRVAKPLNSYLLGEPWLRRAGRAWARRLSARGARVVVNGGNCDWGDINWVHYVHAAWTPTPDGTGLRRLKNAVARRAARAAERASLSRARVVIANSERTRADVMKYCDVPGERVHTVYLGVDAERFQPPSAAARAKARAALGWNDDRPSVVFVGALGDARKGVGTLLAAWRALSSDAGWNARLAVVGAGASLPRLKAEADNGSFGGSIEFLGFRGDVPLILRAADVLVSPVRYEPYGLNVHEALCAGLPALVSATAGVAERYPPAMRGLLLPDPEDSAALADRLRAWRDGQASYAPEVAALSSRLRAQTWQAMASEFFQVSGVAL